MHDLMERRQRIDRRLGDLFRTAIHVPCGDVPMCDWGSVGRAPGERFGFLWPRRFGTEVVAIYSADVIAQQTLWLGDEDLGTYLDVVEFLLTSYVALLALDPERPELELLHQVESDLWDLRPEAMHWASEVQMQILEHSTDPES